MLMYFKVMMYQVNNYSQTVKKKIFVLCLQLVLNLTFFKIKSYLLKQYKPQNKNNNNKGTQVLHAGVIVKWLKTQAPGLNKLCHLLGM